MPIGKLPEVAFNSGMAIRGVEVKNSKLT